jgi:uncharacterized protein (DUF1778 family)
MTTLKIVSTYLTNEEKEQIEKAANLKNQTLSTYVKEIILNKAPPDIPQSWIDKSKSNGFNDIREFLDIAVNSYKLPMIATTADNTEVTRLQSEISRLKAQIVALKTPKVSLESMRNDHERIRAITDNIMVMLIEAHGKYVSFDDLIQTIEIKDESDYNEFLGIIHNMDLDYNSRFGYRIKKVD